MYFLLFRSAKFDGYEDSREHFTVEHHNDISRSTSYGTIEDNTPRIKSSDKSVKELSQYHSNIYSSKVRNASFYKKEKREKKWKPRNVARRWNFFLSEKSKGLGPGMGGAGYRVYRVIGLRARVTDSVARFSWELG